MAFLARKWPWASRGVDDVVAALLGLARLLRPTRRIEIIEQSDGSMRMSPPRNRLPGLGSGEVLRWSDAGFVGKTKPRTLARIARSQVEVVLLPTRFILRPLELPRQATNFLDGIVRSQIDRLTPWSPSEAAFGWSAPVNIASDRLSVTVAATARALVAPIAEAIGAMQAHSVVLSTTLEGSTARIAVFRQDHESARRARRLRLIVIALPVLLSLAAIVSVGDWFLRGADLDAKREDYLKRTAARRLELVSGRGSAAEEAVIALEQKKRATPASVIVLDSLSAALPDDTFLTELHVDGEKLQIAGLTRDAPSLIGLIERTHKFSHATFFAPTTRAPTETGDHFHIEAHIEPHFPAPQ